MNHKNVLLLAGLIALLGSVIFRPSPGPRLQGPMTQDVYVWQRAWTGPVQAAIAEHGGHFAGLAALKAEVVWQGQQPRVIPVAIDYPALQNAGRPIGLALRIGSFSGPFEAHDRRTAGLAELAASLVREAATNGVRVAELQIDFDCAESKLDGYRIWVEAIRRRIAPTPLTITALPAWLDRAACRRLVKATDGFVLQVHSLSRPRAASEPFQLCDPAEARRAVERAGRFGKPFRVALPTYGYRVAFHADGRFAGLMAEGPEKLWPAGTILREVRADPEELARLVAGWGADRPQTLTGIIWYRLPVAGDTLNWPWTTLAAVMAGEAPRGDLRVETRHTQPELVEVDLVNAGRAASVPPARVALRWNEARFVAGDGLQGFELVEQESQGVVFDRAPVTARLEAGQRRMIGWVRLSQPTDVAVKSPANKEGMP